MAKENGAEWSFGFGSNMDPDYLKNVKGLQVLESTPAILKGYRIGFSVQAFPFFEPSFASIKSCQDDEIHGVANKLSHEDAATLRGQEPGYIPTTATFVAYDGRNITGFFFNSSERILAAPDTPCSKRYLNVLVNGAKKANLSEAYIKKLENMPYYVPSQETLEKRKHLPNPEKLPVYTMTDLAARATANGTDYVLTSCLGYVFERYQTARIPPYGRDITSWSMCRLNGIETKTHDGGGRLPFPHVASMRPDELEYAHQLIDYLHRDDPQVRGKIVGFLKEFREQQMKPSEEGFKIVY